MTISFDDALKILDLARQNSSAPAAPAPAGAPQPAAPEQPKYGPHNPVLTAEQAETLHLVWSILGINGKTVGLGRQVTIPSEVPAGPPSPGPAETPITE